MKRKRQRECVFECLHTNKVRQKETTLNTDKLIHKHAIALEKKRERN